MCVSNDSVPCANYFVCALDSFQPQEVVYKINESSNLHPIRQFSNIRKNFRGSNLKQGYCDLPVKKSRICHKLNEITFSPYTENRILSDDHRLGGDDSVPVSGEGRVDLQKVSRYILSM